MRKYIVGVDLGGTNIKSALFDAELRRVRDRSDPTEAAGGPAHVLKRIASIVGDMLEQEGIGRESIICMGMGIPGLLDPDEGLSLFSPNFPGWERVHVVDAMKAYFDFPVFIDNDVRVNLYGEWWFGAGAGVANLALITLGTGLGMGVVVDGNVLYGATSSAGEIGHMNMYREGRLCRCGSSGCLGRYVSAIGMVRTFVEALQAGRSSVAKAWVRDPAAELTARMISDAYDLGDPLARDVFQETGELLGFGLANVVNLFNPELIVVGGGMSAAGERLLGPVREAVARHSLRISSGACKIVTAQLGGGAGTIGAAAYAKRKALRIGASQD